MKKEILDYVIEKTQDLMGSVTCSSEAKAAAQAWLDALGTERELEETKSYIDELEADIVTIDNLIAFAQSEMGSKVFGADKAKEVAAHAEVIKAEGAKYCDCPACVAVADILEKKEAMLS